MTLQVRDAGPGGAARSIVDGVLRLEEARAYHLGHSSGPPVALAFLGQRELDWSAQRQAFTIELGHWVGRSALRLVQGERETVVVVEVVPRAEKLDPRQWLSLLAELEDWTPGLSVGLEGGEGGAVQREGASAPVLAVALLPLVPALIQAVRVITAAPRELEISTREDVPLRTVRRANRETLGWLARHPADARALDPWLSARTGFQDPELPQRSTRDTVDHPVNRYLAWLLGRVVRVLRDLASALRRPSQNVQEPDTAAWCQARLSAAERGAEELSALLRRTFLGALAPAPATEAALLVLQDEPAYSRAHALARPFLSSRFQLRAPEGGGEAPVRPSFELYELWTLLAVQRSLAASLPGWTWTWRPTSGNELLAGFGDGAAFTARGEDGARLGLHYNLTFPGYLADKKRKRYSISRRRRPDLVISLKQTGHQPSWLFLDAKYRVSRRSLAEAFESLHIYRDSLRWEPFGGACRGGLLLCPAIEEACAPWFSEEFRGQFGIGAWRLTPGEGMDRSLAAVVLALLRWQRGEVLVMTSEERSPEEPAIRLATLVSVAMNVAAFLRNEPAPEASDRARVRSELVWIVDEMAWIAPLVAGGSIHGLVWPLDARERLERLRTAAGAWDPSAKPPPAVLDAARDCFAILWPEGMAPSAA